MTKSDSAIPSYTSLGDLTVSEKSSISQLKSLLFENWENLSISALSFLEETDNVTFPEAPTSSKHLRLRDFKGGKVSGPLRGYYYYYYYISNFYYYYCTLLLLSW